MAKDKKPTTAEKLAFAKEHYKKGVEAPSDLQKLVRDKFGSGLRFIDMAKVYPASKRKASAARRQKSATASKPATNGRAKRGRPSAAQRDSIALMVGDEVELFSSRRQLEGRVAELIADGESTDDLAVYERTNMRLTVKNTINL